MISTALKIQDATQEAFQDEQVMKMAAAIYQMRNDVDNETMARMLFEYSATLSALTATLVSHAILSETQMKEMISEINEFEIRERKIKIQFLKLTYLLILLKSPVPISFIQGWNSSQNWLPFGY